MATDITRIVLGVPGPSSGVSAAEWAEVATGYPVIKAASLSSASPDGSTSSTSVYAVAQETTMVLPAGTWTVHASGTVNLRHSATGNVDARLDINGDNGTAVSAQVGITPSDRSRLGFTHTLTGVAGGGSIPIRVEYKAQDAGTVTANNPSIFAIAVRE